MKKSDRFSPSEIKNVRISSGKKAKNTDGTYIFKDRHAQQRQDKEKHNKNI